MIWQAVQSDSRGLLMGRFEHCTACAVGTAKIDDLGLSVICQPDPFLGLSVAGAAVPASPTPGVSKDNAVPWCVLTQGDRARPCKICMALQQQSATYLWHQCDLQSLRLPSGACSSKAGWQALSVIHHAGGEACCAVLGRYWHWRLW